MQIKINLQIFLFMVVFLFTHQIEIYGFIMIFAFIHELGHLIAGLTLKLKPKALSIMPFGISITFEAYGYKKLMEMKKILIALAGPITNIVILIVALFLPINYRIREILVYSNALIALFNLIPLYPLDGGRILKGLIRVKFDEIKADGIVNRISNIIIIFLTGISSIGILYFKNIAILFVLAYLWVIIINENRRYSIKKRTYDILQKDKECIDI